MTVRHHDEPRRVSGSVATTAQALVRLDERLARVEALLETLAKGDINTNWAERIDRRDPGTILRLTQVKEKTGLSRATIYAQQKQRVFPPRVNLGPRAVGWIDSEVDAVIAARASGADETSLKNLVELLVARRQR